MATKTPPENYQVSNLEEILSSELMVDTGRIVDIASIAKKCVGIGHEET